MSIHCMSPNCLALALRGADYCRDHQIDCDSEADQLASKIISGSTKSWEDVYTAQTAEIVRQEAEIEALRKQVHLLEDDSESYRGFYNAEYRSRNAAETKVAEYQLYLEQHPRHLLNALRAAEAKLAAVRGLVERWMGTWAETCADELMEVLGD